MTGMTDGIAGYDGSAGSDEALRWAAREAWARGTTLTICLAWPAADLRLLGDRRMEEDFGRLMTSREKEHPEITVLRQVAVGTPRSALLTAAAEAQMLVVGARGLDGLAGMSLGSVAAALVHHSPCPVAVVHLEAR